jgi:hypothetical protein
MGRHSLPKMEMKCKSCGKDFLIKRHYLRFGKGSFCSKTCLSKSGGQAVTKKYYREALNKPLKKKADYLMRRAISKGTILRAEKCDSCTKTCKPHGHHVDYSEPFLIQWLCARCHLGWHMKRPPHFNFQED